MVCNKQRKKLCENMIVNEFFSILAAHVCACNVYEMNLIKLICLELTILVYVNEIYISFNFYLIFPCLHWQKNPGPPCRSDVIKPCADSETEQSLTLIHTLSAPPSAPQDCGIGRQVYSDKLRRDTHCWETASVLTAKL